MEYQDIINLLDTTSNNVPRFNNKKWIEVHDQSEKIYNTNKQIRLKASMWQSDLCDYSDTCILAEVTIPVGDPNHANYKKKLAF